MIERDGPVGHSANARFAMMQHVNPPGRSKLGHGEVWKQDRPSCRNSGRRVLSGPADAPILQWPVKGRCNSLLAHKDAHSSQAQCQRVSGGCTPTRIAQCISHRAGPGPLRRRMRTCSGFIAHSCSLYSRSMKYLAMHSMNISGRMYQVTSTRSDNIYQI